MTSKDFKQQLREEANQWLAENLIDESFYRQLASRYQFNELDTDAKNRFVMVLIGIGSILLGLAVITFVAANWDGLSKVIKVIILLAFFLLVNTTSFYFWNNYKEGLKYRLGLGLLLLGTLVLGANLGLMYQLFHQSKPLYELYLVWSIAVLIMAYSLRLTILGIVAVILLQIAYLVGITSFDDLYLKTFIFENLLRYLPLFLTIFVIPLAYKCKSQWIFTLTLFLLFESYGVNFGVKNNDFLESSSIVFSFFAISFTCFVPAFLWAYQDDLWSSSIDNKLRFAIIARQLSVLFIGFLFYILSFKFVWQDSFVVRPKNWVFGDYLMFVEPIVLIIVTAIFWWRLKLFDDRKSPANDFEIFGLDLSSLVIALMLILTAILITTHVVISPIQVWGVFFFNLLSGLLALGLIRESLAQGNRLRFWSGIILIILQIFTRMLEYDTDLLFKAFVFLLSGIGIIFAGLWFEKNARVLDS